MKIIITTLGILLFLSTQASSQSETGGYEETLREMMQLQGAEETFTMAIKQTIEMYKGQAGMEIPEKFWDKMEEEMTEKGIDDLIKKLIPVYQKHLTIEDLKSIIDFYKTPAGKKLAEKNPIITQESMQIGQEWGMEIGLRIAKEIKDEGY